MNFEEKTIDSEYLYRGKVITLRKDKIEQHDGKQYIREIVEHNGGVGIVAITPEGKLILVSQFRKPFNEVLVEIPAGKLEINEEPYSCAVRELEEETGYKPLKLVLMTTIYPSPGFLSEKLYIYFCNTMVKGRINFDEGENLLSHYIDFDEALEKVYSGEIKDAKTIVGILMAKKYL
jgi:ADP-ribose pyrophosphatase